MISIVSTSTFRNSLKTICKRPEHGYSSCAHDICEELKGKSLQDIYEMNFLIREVGDLRIIKMRVQNSNENLSKADGYRVILLCNLKSQEVALLKVYPKRGKHGQLDLEKREYKALLKNFSHEKKQNVLVKHNVEKVLEEVP